MTATLPIISIHLPKSGGTSVRRCLHEQFGNRALFDYGRGPLGSRGKEVELGLPNGIDLIHGHFNPTRYDAVGPAFRMTFLREPTDLLLSFYFFWQTMPYEGQPIHRRFLDEKPTLIDFAQWGPIQRLTSESFFGGFDMERMDFVGFHDTRHLDMERVNKLIGLRLDSKRHENETQSGNNERLAIREDQALMSRIRQLLSDDIRFYEALKTKHS